MREIKPGFPYPVEYEAMNGLAAICEVRLYTRAGQTIVVVTDLDVGPSVTNNVERIATVLRQRGITWEVFCEHYLDRAEAQRPETFDWVAFSWQDEIAYRPVWKPGTREQLEWLIGQNFR